jgi:hypothetical protein
VFNRRKSLPTVPLEPRLSGDSNFEFAISISRWLVEHAGGA